jgi:NADH-quinone oxidoreductase subunit M
MPKLMWLFLVPFFSSVVLFTFPTISGKNLKRLAAIASLIPLIILLSSGFVDWIGRRVEYAWLPPLSLDFLLEIDSLSLLFVYLTAIIIPISLLAVQTEDLPSPQVFYGFVLLLQGLLIGFFTARDLLLFTIFWEGMLFPLYFIITLWGKAKRRRAALKFLIYMIAGSSLMVAAVLALYFAAGAVGKETFNLDALANISSNLPYAPWLAGIFFVAFSVKTPLFPLHAWLPDAYYEAPVAGTILLSALLSKAGIYGFLRIGMGLFPEMMREWGPWLLGLAIVGVLYGGLAAWMQKDYKRLLAYSSFSHVNFVLAGIFIWSQIAHQGAILQALNHGVTIAGLFLVAGWLENRLGTTAIDSYSGVAKFMPHLCWLTMVFVLSSIALPGTNNFIGELLILFGLFGHNPWSTAILGLTIILTVIYTLRWMQRVYFEIPSPFQHSWVDIKGKELAIALPLVFLIFWVGIYPKPLLKQIVPAAQKNMTMAKRVFSRIEKTVVKLEE